MATSDLLKEGEQEIGSWTLNYLPPTEGRYTGKLTVTNERLIFDAKFDTSLAGTAWGGLFYVHGSFGYLVIPKSEIKSVESQKSFFKKKIKLTLKDGQVHTFDYGMLSIDKIVSAIEAR